MEKLLQNLFGLRSGEGPRAVLMFFYGMLIITTLSILKPVSNSLFLTQFGVRKLPVVFVLVAVFSGVVAAVYTRYSQRVRLTRLIQISLLASSLGLLVFWILLRVGYQGGWFIYALYIYVAIFGVISGSQYWLLANDIFNAREAKRLFGLIGAGAITGGIIGGYLANYLAPRLRTENLLFFGIGFLLICGGLVLRISRMGDKLGPVRRPVPRRPRRTTAADRNPLRSIIESRHLLYLTGIMAAGVIIADLADYQFSAVASQAIPDADRLTAFFGFWLSTVNLISLAIQLFFTGRILKNFGVAASLFFLPIGLLLGSSAVFFFPSLWSAILLRISDGSFKHSINRAGMELLALPIPAALKQRTKTLIDIFAKNFAKGFGGLLLIFFSTGLGLAVPHISLISIILIAAWIFLVIKARRTYVDAFRHAIEKRSIDPENQPLNLEDAAIFRSFLKALQSPNERQVLYVLKLLEGVRNRELVPHLKRLIEHTSPEVRAQVLRMSPAFPELDLSERARGLLESEELMLQTEGVCYLYKSAADPAAVISGMVRHSDERVRAAAMLCAASEWQTRRDFREAIDMDVLLDGMLEQARGKDVDEDRRRFLKVQTARAVGQLQDPAFSGHLETLIGDSCPLVMEAAVESAGRSASAGLLPTLIGHLSTRKLRKCVREALAGYGDEAIDPLIAGMADSETDERVRLAIPRVLARIGTQRSAQKLLEGLGRSELSLRTAIIRALNRLHDQDPTLRIDPQVVRGSILEEGRLFQSFLEAWARQAMDLADPSPKSDGSGSDLRARRLLVTTLSERLDVCLERILRLLGLKYPTRDMLNVYHGLKSRDPRLRANATEFLDNILEPSLKRIIVPLVESGLPAVRGRRPKRRSRKGIPSDGESLQMILTREDSWLRAVTLYLIAIRGDKDFMATIQNFSEMPDRLVREAARFYLDRINLSPA